MLYKIMLLTVSGNFFRRHRGEWENDERQVGGKRRRDEARLTNKTTVAARRRNMTNILYSATLGDRGTHAMLHCE